ncbi:hypothetical protein NQ314_008180 [Rhamnusium bicolor]|uniref:Cuticle protein n=1 Tax=Rhamnusium bicolor TaxID=1586634 RepID=A0AAV8YDT9_9CUCU|nr:hypothetical protein NQ314_008180 [Rhamnusium bicolor]
MAVFVVFTALVAAANAGHLNLGLSHVRAPAVTYGGLEAVSTYSTIQQHGAPLASFHAPAPVLTYSAPVAYASPVPKSVIAEPSAPAHYDFGYAVSDPHTGDNKSQQESRRGDVVHGSYSLLDSDGTKRTVEYSSDPHNGFNAVVHKEPTAVHVKTAAPVVTPVATPLAVTAAALAPGYTAPIVAHGYSAPIVAHGYATPAW